MEKRNLLLLGSGELEPKGIAVPKFNLKKWWLKNPSSVLLIQNLGYSNNKYFAKGK